METKPFSTWWVPVYTERKQHETVTPVLQKESGQESVTE